MLSLPSMRTSSSRPIKSRIRPSARLPLGVPGGPDNSRICPRASPPPSRLSIGEQQWNTSVVDSIIDAADWVAGIRWLAANLARDTGVASVEMWISWNTVIVSSLKRVFSRKSHLLWST